MNIGNIIFGRQQNTSGIIFHQLALKSSAFRYRMILLKYWHCPGSMFVFLIIQTRNNKNLTNYYLEWFHGVPAENLQFWEWGVGIIKTDRGIAGAGSSNQTLLVDRDLLQTERPPLGRWLTEDEPHGCHVLQGYFRLRCEDDDLVLTPGLVVGVLHQVLPLDGHDPLHPGPATDHLPHLAPALVPSPTTHHAPLPSDQGFSPGSELGVGGLVKLDQYCQPGGVTVPMKELII